MERGARAYHLRGQGRGRLSQGQPSTATATDVPLHTREKNWNVDEIT
jgi:hypothetical protein